MALRIEISVQNLLKRALINLHIVENDESDTAGWGVWVWINDFVLVFSLLGFV